MKLGVSAQLLKNKLIFSGLGYKFEDDEGEGIQIHDKPGDVDQPSGEDTDTDSTTKNLKVLGQLNNIYLICCVLLDLKLKINGVVDH